MDGNTFHKLLGIDVKTRKYDKRLINKYCKGGLKYFLIDEISMIPSWIWNILAHIKKQFNILFIGCGDWKQLPPVEEEDIDFSNSWVVKYLFHNKSYELTKVWRFNENDLLQDAYKASNGEQINLNNYTNIEHPLALCYTNDAVDAINKNGIYIIQKNKQKQKKF